MSGALASAVKGSAHDTVTHCGARLADWGQDGIQSASLRFATQHHLDDFHLTLSSPSKPQPTTCAALCKPTGIEERRVCPPPSDGILARDDNAKATGSPSAVSRRYRHSTSYRRCLMPLDPTMMLSSASFESAIMSQAYEGQDPMKLAQQAERDLNSEWAKNEHKVSDTARHAAGASDSTAESGVDQSVQQKFPGASVTYGSAASGAGDNREIPLSEGGDINPATGKPYKAGDFEGAGGPEDKARAFAEAQGGSDAIRSNIRQGGETVRPAGSMGSDAVGGTGKQTGQESG
ncbi:hypothetical protein D0869_01574 [Hortaea werneckii]|uniref:Uncharacterized protein n=2 Tax=Hortaea werneckii TaxID=91943 RepID=A0A3M6XCS5_HORWE|nr:hypothetical protein D0869_01574 [Hortaea werneckii]